MSDIRAPGKHLLSPITGTLDLSPAEAANMMLNLEPVPVSSLFAPTLSLVREKAAAQNINLDMIVPDELGTIRADARKVEQIVYHLLSNAVNVTTDGGRVTLRAARVPRAEVGRLSGTWTGRTFPLADSEFTDFLKISVTDSGIGISSQGLAHLFQPFNLIDRGLARTLERTGSGLSLVKLVAELHGGVVAVESAVGEGSCFTVWLPLQPPDGGTTTVANTPLPVSGRWRVRAPRWCWKTIQSRQLPRAT